MEKLHKNVQKTNKEAKKMNVFTYFTQDTTLGDAVPEEVKEVAEVVQHTNAEKIMEWFQDQIPTIVRFGIQLCIFLFIFFVGRKLIKWITKLVAKALEKSSVEQSAEHFLVSVVRVLLYIVLVMILAGYLGVGGSSIVAILGSAGLAIGLALQGSLSNFAGGVLILLLKPFKVGDYIITAGGEGVVENIDLFYTKLLTGDNKMIVIPNGSITNDSITNVTNQPKRRVDLEIGIDYSQNIGIVKEVLENIVQSYELTLKEEEIAVFVSSFDASAITIGLRFWTTTEDYWTARCSVLESIKTVFDERGISIPYNQLDVNLVSVMDSKKTQIELTKK